MGSAAILLPAIKSTVMPEQMAKLVREMDKVQGQYQQAEQTYGADLQHLVVANSYLTKLLANEAVHRNTQTRVRTTTKSVTASVPCII
jgi:hypothetical protein